MKWNEKQTKKWIIKRKFIVRFWETEISALQLPIYCSWNEVDKITVLQFCVESQRNQSMRAKAVNLKPERKNHFLCWHSFWTTSFRLIQNAIIIIEYAEQRLARGLISIENKYCSRHKAQNTRLQHLNSFDHWCVTAGRCSFMAVIVAPITMCAVFFVFICVSQLFAFTASIVYFHFPRRIVALCYFTNMH